MLKTQNCSLGQVVKGVDWNCFRKKCQGKNLPAFLNGTALTVVRKADPFL